MFNNEVIHKEMPYKMASYISKNKEHRVFVCF